MAWREARAAWRLVAVVVSCIAVGVAALVGVASFAASLDRTLSREAKSLLGGDLELRAARPLPAPALDLLARWRARGAAVTEVRELVGMARDPRRGASLLVELKAVENGYPLYGTVGTDPARPLGDLLGDTGAVVQEALLGRLGLRLGDPLEIGVARFTITAVLRQEPDRSLGFDLGPRVLIGAGALERTGLVAFGSRVRYRTLLRLPDGIRVRAVRVTLLEELADPGIRVTSFTESQPGLRRFFDQLTTYLGLVGLVSLLVGGIGVAASVRSFLERKRATIAILKCLGAESRRITATYLLQALALGAVGSAAGAGLGLAVRALMTPLLDGFVPFQLAARLEPWAIARGLAMGLGTTLLCALWPLRRIRSVPPALILRLPVEPAPAPTRRPWIAALPVAAGLAALAFWQAGNPRVAAMFLGASLAALAVLAGLARGLVAVTLRLPRLPSLAWRHGIGALHRPGGQTAGIVISLGVGVMLIVTVALLERSLGAHIDLERRREAPSFFFVDVQPDQAEPFARVVERANGGSAPALTPVVRSRLVGINGKPVGRERTEGREDAWRFSREYVLTFAAGPPPGTVITRGRWWTPAEAAARPRVSVEEEAARAFGVGVGGTLTFDVQGVPVEAEVMSLRKVDWQSLSTNFFVIFSPGALDGAPMSYVGTARVPAGAESRVQDAVVGSFPNVTAIPVRDVLERLGRIMDQVAVAVRLVAAFVIGAGVVVMASALGTTRYQRLYESALLRTLGATRAMVGQAFAVEYACLGAAAGVGGTALALVLAWAVLRFVLDVPFGVAPGLVALGVTLPVVLALGVGFLGTFRLLGGPPLPLLRRE